MKQRKKSIITLLAVACTLSGIGAITACNDSSKEPKVEMMGETNRTIETFVLPETATCGYGSYCTPKTYYAYDSYGIRQNTELSVYDKDYELVELDKNGGFTVNQPIGTNYYFLYRAKVDNDVLTKRQTVKVMDDSGSPVLNVLQENVIAMQDDAVNLANYYLVEDDSQADAKMEYEVTYNGEDWEYGGETFYADAGDYVFRLRAIDGSGHESEWKEIKLLVRSSNVVADFEVESDIYEGDQGVQGKGTYTVSRSTQVVRSGNYSMKLQKKRGAESPSLQFVHGFHGETNGVDLNESYLYFGFWAYFEPKDNSGEINIRYTSTKYKESYHWDNALSHMWFYVDGELVGDGLCNGSKTVKLPTEKWVYIVGEIVEYANTAFTLLTDGYTDDTFTAYIDDMTTAHSVQVKSTNVTHNYYYEEDAVFDLDAELDPYIKEYSSAANLQRPVYQVYKCDDQGAETAVPVSEDNTVTLSPGEYKIYYAGADGSRAGEYTKLTVRKTLQSLVEYDTDGNGIETMPCGVVGKAYKIPQASVLVAGTTVETSVLFDGKAVTVENGKFTPSKAGVYTLSYTFKQNGASETFTYSITVENDYLQGELSSNFEDVEKQTSCFVGEKLLLPEVSATGGSGKITQWVEVTLNGESVSLTDGVFVPQKDGTYQVTSYSKDYFTVLEESYTVTVTYSKEPIFENLPKLPIALISEYGYSMTAPNVFTYTQNGKTEFENVKGYWEYKGNRHAFDDVFTPVVEQSGDKVKVIYVAGEYEYELGEFTVQIPWLEIGYFNPSAYFLPENDMNVTADVEATILSSTTSGATATYINPLASEPWSFTFMVDDTKNNGTFKIILTDYENPSIALTLKFEKKDATTSWLYVNDNAKITVNGSFINKTNSFSLIFNRNMASLTDNNTGKLLATLGEKFSTLGENGLKMQIVFEDVVGEFALNGYMLNKQTLYLQDEDGGGPILLKNGEFALIQYLNKEFVLPSCRSFDAFDYGVLPQVTLKKLGGSFVTTVDGVTLDNADATKDYRLLIQEEGTYYLTYSACDSNGNEVSLSYMLKVQLFGKTTSIEVDGKLEYSAKVGDSFKIPSATGYDKNDEELPVSTYVCYPNGRIVKCTSGSVNLEEKGTYEIIFYVRDDSGCPAIKTITITVK